ncbi:MAG: hypothetical protein NT023_16955 [Armatimonadetes bacterium]|nr:hypothetical protein [Armatimonadota bacterium]
MRASRVMTVVAFAFLHLFLFFAVNLSGIEDTYRFVDDGTPPKRQGRVVRLLTRVLPQPAGYVAHRLNLRSYSVIVPLALLNSLLWGLCGEVLLRSLWHMSTHRKKKEPTGFD